MNGDVLKAPVRVFLVSQPTIGGAAQQVWQLAAELDPRAFAVTVVSPEGGWLRTRTLDSGGRHHVVDMVRGISPIADIRALLTLAALLRKERPGIVHCHSSKAGFLGRVAARLARVPIVVYTPHGFSFLQERGPRALLYLLLERFAARLSDLVICVSPAERAAAVRYRLTESGELVVIRNGVTIPENLSDGRGRLRGLLQVGQECQIVAMVSRLRPPKHPDDLIHAAALLARGDMRIPFRLVFIGDGPLKRELQDTARSLGITEMVFFLGDRPDVDLLLPDIDVAVLASDSEGMPYSLLEAMAAGKAVVATRAPWIEDLVLEGKNGYGYGAGRPDELAAVLRRLLEDEALLRRLGREGRRMVAARFPAEKMVSETADQYRRLIAERSGHTPRSPGITVPRRRGPLSEGPVDSSLRRLGLTR